MSWTAGSSASVTRAMENDPGPWNLQQKHLKNGWLMMVGRFIFPFGFRPILRGENVSFRECKIWNPTVMEVWLVQRTFRLSIRGNFRFNMLIFRGACREHWSDGFQKGSKKHPRKLNKLPLKNDGGRLLSFWSAPFSWAMFNFVSVGFTLFFLGGEGVVYGLPWSATLDRW